MLSPLLPSALSLSPFLLNKCSLFFFCSLNYQITKEKIDLENQLEAEEEYIVNKLQKQLNSVTAEKQVLEHQLDKERVELIEKLLSTVQIVKDTMANSRFGSKQTKQRKPRLTFCFGKNNSSVSESEKELVQTLAQEIQALRNSQKLFEREREECLP